ncbi:MAG: hypothetical protein J0M04_23600 [Verrucomicrobia bacterium]|nr:hypothetical protein [Verrucomicrobiota bacterium]
MQSSPLAATAIIVAALGALAIPLRHLTTSDGNAPAPASPAATPAQAADTPAILRLKLLSPAKSVRVLTSSGKVLLQLDQPPAGESEHETKLPLADGKTDLTLEADLGDTAADTALFLTVMPDALDPQTRYLIGTGQLTESFAFTWPPS